MYFLNLHLEQEEVQPNFESRRVEVAQIDLQQILLS